VEKDRPPISEFGLGPAPETVGVIKLSFLSRRVSGIDPDSEGRLMVVCHLESAGGVVLARGDRDERYVALVRKHDDRWVLPKGHREDDETLEAAALREVEEETGIPQAALAVRRYLGGFDFNENAPGSGICKLNHFFLMDLRGENWPKLSTDDAHAGAAWHRLPVKGITMAYPYQEELLAGLAGATALDSG
jgi:8-oxo-dGTP pyrophosphatase MutT (NUDIX family)